MEHKPYNEATVRGHRYWDYNFFIKDTVYEVSVDKDTGKLYINEDEIQPEIQKKVCDCCGKVLTIQEIKEKENKCFPCLKGNCELCN